MTTNDMQKLIDCFEDYVPKYFSDLPDNNGNYDRFTVVKFNDVMKFFNEYSKNVVEEEDNRTNVSPDYEDMYNRCLDSLEELRAEVRKLKKTNEIQTSELKYQAGKLTEYAAALHTVEAMTGNRLPFMWNGGDTE